MIVMALCLVMCCVLAGCNTTGDANATAGNVDNSTGNGTVAPTDPTEPEFVLGIETAQKSPALYLTTAIEKNLCCYGIRRKGPLGSASDRNGKQGFPVFLRKYSRRQF